MNRFVQECRREWKRLRVPDAIANEMAADLSADLAEAEAEGASPEDVLGDAVFDAQSFAASWAAERGVVAPPQADAVRGRPATPLLLAGAVMLVTVLVGAVLVVSGGSGSTEARLAIGASAAPFKEFRRPGFGTHSASAHRQGCHRLSREARGAGASRTVLRRRSRGRRRARRLDPAPRRPGRLGDRGRVRLVRAATPVGAVVGSTRARDDGSLRTAE